MKSLSSNIYAFFVISQQHRLGTSKKSWERQLMMKMVCGGSEMLALPVLSVSAGQCIQSQALSTATQPATGSQRALLSFAQLCSGSIGTKLSACYMCYSSSLLSKAVSLNFLTQLLSTCAWQPLNPLLLSSRPALKYRSSDWVSSPVHKSFELLSNR